jgi:hypothetical protein
MILRHDVVVEVEVVVVECTAVQAQAGSEDLQAVVAAVAAAVKVVEEEEEEDVNRCVEADYPSLSGLPRSSSKRAGGGLF